MRRTLRRHHDLRGDEFPGVDDILAQFDPSPDLSEQMYKQKVAHLCLLNFARPTLAIMLADGRRGTMRAGRPRESRRISARAFPSISLTARARFRSNRAVS